MRNTIWCITYTIIITFIALLGLLAFVRFAPAIPVSVSSVVSDKGNAFSVSGEGKVTAKPDIAEVTLGVTKTASTVAISQSEANKIINSVTSAIKALGIAEKDIKTVSYQISPEYNYSGTRTLTGYTTSINLQVKVRDFQKIDLVIDRATGMGANEVGGLTFSVDEPEKLKDKARKEAIGDAKKKARKIAEEAGITLGRVINVTESAEGGPVPRLYMAADSVAKGGGETNIQPGESEIKVTVTLSYETR